MLRMEISFPEPRSIVLPPIPGMLAARMKPSIRSAIYTQSAFVLPLLSFGVQTPLARGRVNLGAGLTQSSTKVPADEAAATCEHGLQTGPVPVLLQIF